MHIIAVDDEKYALQTDVRRKQPAVIAWPIMMMRVVMVIISA